MAHVLVAWDGFHYNLKKRGTRYEYPKRQKNVQQRDEAAEEWLEAKYITQIKRDTFGMSA